MVIANLFGTTTTTIIIKSILLVFNNCPTPSVFALNNGSQ